MSQLLFAIRINLSSLRIGGARALICFTSYVGTVHRDGMNLKVQLFWLVWADFEDDVVRVGGMN